MTPAIYCRYRALRDLPTDRQAAANWLSAGEHAAWRAMRSAARQTTWLAGRVLAKQLITECLGERGDRLAIAPPTEIHIESQSSTKRLGTRPTVFVSGKERNWGLSIAHSGRGVLVAVAMDATVGVDLVASDECRAESLAWCFSAGERRWLATLPTDGRGAERLWAMKEAVFKASHAGEAFAPQRIDLAAAAEQVHSSLPAVRQLQCWRVDAHVAALAVADRPRRFPNH